MLLQRPTSPVPSEWLLVSVDWVHGTVALRGELDRESAHHLADALTALAAADHPCWVVDTAEVSWCDAGGLRALAAAHAAATAAGRQLRLVRPSRCVERLVRLSGLDEQLAAAAEPTTARPGRGNSPAGPLGGVSRPTAVTRN